jgi:hypothetical protein
MSILSRLFYRPLPPHLPAKKWHVPLAWHPDLRIGYSVTTFYEDLPSNCYDCGEATIEERLEPMWIEGDLQYMKLVRRCPKGCGFTVWIA